MAKHDRFFIGSSMGAIELLMKILKELPKDWPAALLIVHHISPDAPSILPEMLKAAARLTVLTAQTGQRITNGSVYVCPPDEHLLVQDDQILLSHGPRENRRRPAIDTMFRSAAVNFGPRAVGIILSGLLDDGADGLSAIKKCGGVTIIQDPKDALHPDMPYAAQEESKVDYSVPVIELPALIMKIAQEKAGKSVDIPDDIKADVKMTQLLATPLDVTQVLKDISYFTCPDCGGTLGETPGMNAASHWQCYLGHRYSLHSLLSGQAEKLYEAFYTALRIIEEHLRLLKKIQKEERARKRSFIPQSYQKEIDNLHQQAVFLRQVLTESFTALKEPSKK